MANKNMPCGLEPYGDIMSEGIYIAGSNVFPGEAVTRASDGKIDAATSSSALLGVCQGKAVDGEKVLVCDHPDQKYLIQATSAQINTITDIGQLYNLLATSESTQYAISRMQLDSSSGSSSAGHQLRLLGVLKTPVEDFGLNAKCIVKMNLTSDSDHLAGI